MSLRRLLMAGGTTATDPNFANVVLLLHGNGTNGSTTITDVKGKTVTPHGSAQISTAQSKFGGSSIALLASGDYLTVPTSSDFAFGTGDFTIEGWNYYASGTANQCLIDLRSASTLNYAVYMSLAGNTYRLSVSDGTTTTAFLSRAFSPNTQEHWAVVRDSGTIRGYIGGVQGGSFADSRSLAAPPTSLFIGDNYLAPSQSVLAYADDIRITKGVCRYPGGTSFTPPTAQFPDS